MKKENIKKILNLYKPLVKYKVKKFIKGRLDFKFWFLKKFPVPTG